MLMFSNSLLLLKHIIVAGKITGRKYSPHTMITKCDFILRDSYFCETYINTVRFSGCLVLDSDAREKILQTNALASLVELIRNSRNIDVIILSLTASISFSHSLLSFSYSFTFSLSLKLFLISLFFLMFPSFFWKSFSIFSLFLLPL